MAELAMHVHVGRKAITINGEEFPWHVADEAIVAEAEAGRAVVYLPVLAERITFDL